ncbi:putative quinol monooxygenase [Novosphingobium sp.]|nr:antibiotic biosynthesis monooxygenase [Novosphingobium sp.]HKR92820.1 antibiotic biosynthesis monooxygenase [Novosphingobium sp.]
MTFGMVVMLRVHEGRDADFMATISELASVVAATEPGTRLYLPMQVRDAPGSYVIMELYDREADHDSHMENPQARPYFARLNELIAERTNVLNLDPFA